MADKIYRYWIAVPSGLEAVALDELREHVPEVQQVDVEPGDEVQEGQALCTIEAMKMENILRAEKKGTVSKINAGAGDSLAVDDVIMEFE